MSIVKQKKSHIWDRDPDDWYVEPFECSRALFDLEQFNGKIWDPSCGLGRILTSAEEAGYPIVGSDIISRGHYCNFERDFLSISKGEVEFENIVSNPPFNLAEKFVRHGLELLPHGGKMAMILPMVWLSGFSTKRDWLPHSPLRKYFAISPRPSMPPGAVIEAGVKAGNGTKDFAWFIWEKGYCKQPLVGFMNTKPYK